MHLYVPSPPASPIPGILAIVDAGEDAGEVVDELVDLREIPDREQNNDNDSDNDSDGDGDDNSNSGSDNDDSSGDELDFNPREVLQPLVVPNMDHMGVSDFEGDSDSSEEGEE